MTGLPFAIYPLSQVSPGCVRVPPGVHNPGHGGPGRVRARAARVAVHMQLHPVPGLRYRRADRRPVPWMQGATVSRGRAGQTREALHVLGLIIRWAPADVCARFRDELRSWNLADRGGPAAPPNAARSWSRPNLYARCFTAVLDDLGQPEQALAPAAITTLSEPARDQRARPDTEMEVSEDD